MGRKVNCPTCNKPDDVGMGDNDYCCHKCKFFWPKTPNDPRLVHHIMVEMRAAPGRLLELEHTINRMSVPALRELHRLLRELNSNTSRAKSQARRGLPF